MKPCIQGSLLTSLNSATAAEQVINQKLSNSVNGIATKKALGNNKQVWYREQPKIEAFKEHGRVTSPAYQFYNDFLFKVLRPEKILISTNRIGAWDLQQSPETQLLPFHFITNRSNHAKYMLVVTLQILRLPVIHAFRDSY